MSTRATRGITPWKTCSRELVHRRKLRRSRSRMRINVAFAVVGACLLLNAPKLLAHHSFAAEFDAHRPVKLRGIVTRMEWINPHAWIHVDVKGPDGKIISW